MRRLAVVLAVSVGLVAAGIAGAWAFNPDDGAVWHAEALWRIFGIGAYIGIVTFWLAVFAAPFVFVIGVCKRRHAARA